MSDPVEDEEVPIPIKPISGATGGMPSWADYMKQLEEEEARNPTPVAAPVKRAAVKRTAKATGVAPPALSDEALERKRKREEEAAARRAEIAAKRSAGRPAQETSSTDTPAEAPVPTPSEAPPATETPKPAEEKSHEAPVVQQAEESKIATPEPAAVVSTPSTTPSEPTILIAPVPELVTPEPVAVETPPPTQSDPVFILTAASVPAETALVPTSAPIVDVESNLLGEASSLVEANGTTVSHPPSSASVSNEPLFSPTPVSVSPAPASDLYSSTSSASSASIQVTPTVTATPPPTPATPVEPIAPSITPIVPTAVSNTIIDLPRTSTPPAVQTPVAAASPASPPVATSVAPITSAPIISAPVQVVQAPIQQATVQVASQDRQSSPYAARPSPTFSAVRDSDFLSSSDDLLGIRANTPSHQQQHLAPSSQSYYAPPSSLSSFSSSYASGPSSSPHTSSFHSSEPSSLYGTPSRFGADDMERLRSELLNQFRGVLGNYEHSMLQLVERQSRKRMESLLEHNEQLKRQNAELELQLRTLRSSHESASQQAASAHKELSVIRARVQLTDSKVATLTEQLQLKTHENSKLTQLCDELIANLEAAQAQ